MYSYVFVYAALMFPALFSSEATVDFNGAEDHQTATGTLRNTEKEWDVIPVTFADAI